MDSEIEIVQGGAKLFLKEKSISEIEDFLIEHNVSKADFPMFFDQMIIRAKQIQEQKWRRQRKYIIMFSSLLLILFAFSA